MIDITRQPQFFFERHWNNLEGFGAIVAEKWQQVIDKCPIEAYSLDVWHGALTAMRRFLKGWGANLRGEYKMRRGQILSKIQKIDEYEREGGLCLESNGERHVLEMELERIMEEEEIYW